MKALGESVPGYKIRDMIKEVDIDENGTVEFGEFLTVSSIAIVLELLTSRYVREGWVEWVCVREGWVEWVCVREGWVEWYA